MSLYFVHISQYQTQVLTGAVCFGSITFGTAAFESLLKKNCNLQCFFGNVIVFGTK